MPVYQTYPERYPETIVPVYYCSRTIEEPHINKVCILYILQWNTMKWICVYCNKVMDSTNFMDFIKDSDNGEYHGWQRLPERARVDRDQTEYLLQLA